MAEENTPGVGVREGSPVVYGRYFTEGEKGRSVRLKFRVRGHSLRKES